MSITNKLPGAGVPRSAWCGFSLIELMVVVAILSVLAAIALPAYQDYVRRGQLQEAFTFLADYRVKMEQYYQDNKNYGAVTGTTCATSTTASTWNSFAPSGAKYFTFGCVTASSGEQFTVTATGSAGTTIGYVYTIDYAGTKATTMYGGAAVTLSCWKSGSSC